MKEEDTQTDSSFEIDQCQCPHGTGIQTHVLSKVVCFEFVCAVIRRI